MKVDWCLSETVVIDGQGGHLKVEPVLQEETQYGECADVCSVGEEFQWVEF